MASFATKRPGMARSAASAGMVGINVAATPTSAMKPFPADGSTPGFVALMADMTQTYGATSHCDVTTYASMKREKRFRALRKSRGADAVRDLCLKFVNLDDHGSGVGYEGSVPVPPKAGMISPEKMAEISKRLERWEVPPVTVTFARAGNVSVVCYSKIENARDAAWVGLSEQQLRALMPKTLHDKGGRRKSTSDDGGNLAADARLILNFFIRARAAARWASAKKKIMAWRAFQKASSGPAAAGPPSVPAARRRVSTTGAMDENSPMMMLQWPQSKFLEKEMQKFMVKLEGVYGLVLSDVEKRTMVAARDKHGVVPLFVGVTKDNTVAVASESGLLPDDVKTNLQMGPGEFIFGTFEDVLKDGAVKKIDG